MAEARGQSRRDRGMTALVLGFFAAAWFGWGSGAAPDGVLLVVYAAVALVRGLRA